MKERIARALGCLILAVAVAACAGGLSGYSKTGVSDQQKSTDYYECQRDSSVLVRRAKGMEEYVLDTDKLNACMRARGYEVQDRQLELRSRLRMQRGAVPRQTTAAVDTSNPRITISLAETVRRTAEESSPRWADDS